MSLAKPKKPRFKVARHLGENVNHPKAEKEVKPHRNNQNKENCWKSKS